MPKKKKIEQLPAAAENQTPAATIPTPFATKKQVAEFIGLSVRTVDSYLALGLPHLKLGKRRCRFDLAEVKAWLNDNFRVQRRAA